MEKSKKISLLALSSIPLIMTLGNSMLIPILPSMGQQLKVSSFQISLVITVYSVVAIFLIPVAGFLSDRYGRVKIIIPSLVLTGLGGLLSAIASTWFSQAYMWILVGRFIQGIGAAGSSPIVLPLIGDMFKQETEVSEGLGIIETANTFGKVLSPLMGSLLALIAWFIPFWAIPVLCLGSILMVSFMVKVPKKNSSSAPPKARAYIKQVKALFHEKGRWLYAIFAIGGICMFIVFGALFYLSQVSEDKYGIHGLWKGVILAIPTAALCIASFVTGKLIGNKKPRMKWFNFFGMLIVSVMMLVIAWFGGKTVVMDVLYISIGAFGIGISLPCLDALIVEGIEKEVRGTVTSFYSSVRFIGVAAGPPVASVMLLPTAAPFYYLVAGLGGASVLLSLFGIKPKQQDNKKQDKEQSDSE